MKKYLLILFALLQVHSSWAQLNVYVDKVSKDSVISTPFDTLNIDNSNGKPLITDKVVGIKNVHGKTAAYWLFFYFAPSHTNNSQSITIRKGLYAYFGLTNGTYVRIPYDGKTFTYNYPQMAGFFVNVSPYISLLKNAKLNFVRLETSDVFHEIDLKDAGNRIAALLQSLQ